MASRADVTVSIVNTDNRGLLLACLETLDPGEAEIVVLDNASEDGSAEAVRERFPDVRAIAQDFRTGFGANHNTIVRSTSGRYVYVLNEDTTSEPGAFDRMVSYLDAHPEVGALGPRIVYPDGRLQASAWRFPGPVANTIGALTLSKLGLVQSGGDRIKRVDWVMGAALLVRRAALERAGLFDEGFFLYSEETDLCFRIASAGYEIHYFPPVTVVHHVGQTSAKIPERRINEQWRSRHRYWAKHHSPAGARVAALAMGWQYVLRAGIAALVLRLPEGRRPIPVRPTDPAEFRLHARDAWRVTGPGLQELAEEWNGRMGAPR